MYAIIFSIGLSNDLEGMEEDVQSTNQIFSVNDFAKIISQQSNTVPSQADDKIYIEGSDRFKAKNRLKVDQKRAEELERSQNENMDIYPTILTSQAIQIHKIFKTFSLFVSGLFAGIALWQIITSYIMYNNGVDNFLRNHSTLSAPLQCFYYMLFAVCIVYALDRYDITHPSPHFWNKVATFQSGAFCIIIYIIGLIFSLAISNIEYRMTFHQSNSSIIDPNDSRTTNMLYIWQILNLIRGLMAIIGWGIISLKPMTDRLLKALSNYRQTITSSRDNRVLI
ncbi:hypothetical protein HELRODRAFT_162513 [Helobdella robusta]|uniref:Uncharacterized protein n=1 Tax=Helobdella robusta TaxID=6412 RepID=T1ESS3_HELRO|nr:hypothetical protein HELRODRAFT_162513 [Helobdella robusta]ESN99035.1 hypothetical protein HELRODRAFT_162513 [Helobdella robusta]